MKTVKIGLIMLSDERENVAEATRDINLKVIQKWKEAIEKDFKDTGGSRPEIIVGSNIITSIKEAKQVGRELLFKGCDTLIALYNVWNFPYFIWPLVNTFGKDKPILSLSNNNGKFPGNVGLLATDGALRQAGLRTHRIIGEVEDKHTRKRVVDWIRAAIAISSFKGEVFGLYGGHSMGMETGYFHLIPNIKTFGTTCYQIDQLWLEKKMDEVNKEEIEDGFNWFTKLLGDRIKYDGKLLTPEILRTQIRLYLAIRNTNNEYGFDFCGIKGQRELTEYMCTADIAEMLLNDPYDWNGPKEPFVCATEADAYAAITMQIFKYISGSLPSLFMDVRLYHPDKDLWDFCNSGEHASWYAARSSSPEENFSKVSLHPADFYFKAGGASVEFDAAPGNLTLARLGIWDNKVYMVAVDGKILDLPEDQRIKINNETSPNWPHAHTKLNCEFKEFIDLFPCNHILGVAGDYLESLVYLCEILKITPIILGDKARERNIPIWERIKGN